MKADSQSTAGIILGLPFCALIFVADLRLPLGVAVWLGYVVVVAVTAWLSNRRATVVLAAVSSLLIAIGYVLSPQGILPWIAGINRIAGVALIWAAAYLVSNRRQLHASLEQQAEALTKANEQLARQALKLANANELLQSQAAEVRDANALLQQQAEELEVQAEELHAQNEDLLTLTDTLDRNVQERTGQLRRANQALLAMSAKLTAVQENERRVISRELHDESGQLLTSILIRLGLLRDLWARGESPIEAIDELKQTTGQLADGLHRLAVNLRPASLDRAGLVAALEQYIDSYHKTFNLQVDLVTDGLEDARLPAELESTLYRIIQEALTNVARHAHASHVSVVLSQRSNLVTAIIDDDGIGFDVEAARSAGRLGLTGMQERAEMRGGTLTIESQPGSGTTVYVEVSPFADLS